MIITGSKVKEGVWTHIAGTYDSLSQTMILYVNGQSVGRYEEIAFQPNSCHPLHVGAGATEQAGASSCFFHGSITKVRIWDRALSLAEIQIAAELKPDERETPSIAISPPAVQLQPLPTTPISQVFSTPTAESLSPTELSTPQITQLEPPSTPQVLSTPTAESLSPTEISTPQIAQLEPLPNTPTPQVPSTPSAESLSPLDFSTPQIVITHREQQPQLNEPNPSVLSSSSPQVKQTGEKPTSKVTASKSNELNKESEETAYHQVINANHVTIHRVTRQYTEVRSKSLHPVLMFNGKDDYIEIPYSSTLDFAQDQDFAIEVWLKPDAVQQGEGKATFDINVLEKWLGTPFPYAIRYSSKNGRVYASRYDGKKNPAVYSTQPINDLQLHYITFVKQSSQLHLYVDGVEAASTNDTTIETTQNNSSLYLCRGAGGRNFFKGQIAEFRIWNRARSPVEIQADMSRRLVGNEAGLVGYWPLNEGTGCIVNDKTNNANHGKIHEATWVNG